MPEGMKIGGRWREEPKKKKEKGDQGPQKTKTCVGKNVPKNNVVVVTPRPNGTASFFPRLTLPIMEASVWGRPRSCKNSKNCVEKMPRTSSSCLLLSNQHDMDNNAVPCCYTLMVFMILPRENEKPSKAENSKLCRSMPETNPKSCSWSRRSHPGPGPRIRRE